MLRTKQRPTIADIENSLWIAEAQVSAQRSRVESLMENRLNPDRAEAALRDLFGLVRECQARRAAFMRHS
jgi:hypothetical protein